MDIAKNGMKLKSQLGLFPATNIVVANMVGAGIFTTSGLLMAGLHNPILMMVESYNLQSIRAITDIKFFFSS